jgi:Flp pilus assembly protein TadG
VTAISWLCKRSRAAHPRLIIANLKGFGHANAGVAAVEFALILPVMIAMYLGMTELTIGINTNRKLMLLSRTLADLTSRMKNATVADMDKVFAAARAVMQPYSAADVAMTVTSVGIDGPSDAPVGKVKWSCRRGSASIDRAVGSSYSVPNGFETAKSFILVETSLDYMPMFGGRFIGRAGVLPLGQTTPWPVRDGDSVEWIGAVCPPPPPPPA